MNKTEEEHWYTESVINIRHTLCAYNTLMIFDGQAK